MNSRSQNIRSCLIAVLLAGFLGTGSTALTQPSPASHTQNQGLPTHVDSTAASAITDSLHAQIQHLDRMATDIKNLFDGSLPEGFNVQTMFEVDLLDETAVATRRQQLSRTIAQRDSLPPDADSLTTTLRKTQNRVDWLRLQFLSRSPEERQRINDAERRRRQLLREQGDAAQARREAELRAAQAEAQHQQALEDAAQQQSAVLEEVARDMARLQSSLAGVASVAATLAQQRETQAQHAQDVLAEVLRLEQALQSAINQDTNSDAVFAATVRSLDSAHTFLARALERWASPTAVPAAVSREAPHSVSSDSAFVGRVARLDSLAERLQLLRAQVRRDELDYRWQAVTTEASHVGALDSLRLRCFELLSDARRRQVLGLGRTGLQQIRLETRDLVLTARVYAASRWRNIHLVPAALRDLFKVGTAFYILLRVALVVVIASVVRRRWPRMVTAAQRALLRNVRDARDARRVRSIVGTLRAVLPWSLFLVGIQAFHWSLQHADAWPEIQVLLRLATWYGVYRLSVSVLYALLVKIAVHYFTHVPPTMTLRVLRTVRHIVGVFFLAAILRDLSRMMVGTGALSHLTVVSSWILVLLTLLFVLRSWRESISAAYLRLAPEGRLKTVVQRTSDRHYAVFVVLAAFVWLAGRTVVVVGRDFALGFDQVRRALAFLFRRRMEKRAEKTGYSDGDLTALPESLLKSFTEEPVSEGDLVIDHFPGIKDLERALTDWASSGAGGSFLLIGERGMGKTSWLQQVHGLDGMKVHRCQLDDRVWTRRQFVDELRERLLPEGASITQFSDLQRALAAKEPHVIVLDMCQNLFLGKVGGYAAFEAFSELMTETRSNVFWVCACNSHAWAHLEAVRPDLSLFERRHTLTPWSEEQIRELIDARLAASGVELEYRDLLLDRIDATSTEDRVLGIEEAFVRLLWDFSAGNPRAALHYWLRSLVPESPTLLRVRLFKTPQGDILEQGGETGLFLLAAVVVHENVTVQEAAATTRFSLSICRLHLDRFVGQKVLSVSRGRYRLSTQWQRTVVRLLGRRNLLAD